MGKTGKKETVFVSSAKHQSSKKKRKEVGRETE